MWFDDLKSFFLSRRKNKNKRFRSKWVLRLRLKSQPPSDHWGWTKERAFVYNLPTKEPRSDLTSWFTEIREKVPLRFSFVRTWNILTEAMSSLPQASGRSWRQNTKKAYRKPFSVQRLLFESYVDLILAILIHINQRNIILTDIYCNDKKVLIIFLLRLILVNKQWIRLANLWRRYNIEHRLRYQTILTKYV